MDPGWITDQDMILSSVSLNYLQVQSCQVSWNIQLAHLPELENVLFLQITTLLLTPETDLKKKKTNLQLKHILM